MIVTAISLYPVKAFCGYAVDAAAVEPWGLAGDRRWMVVDPAGRFITQRQHPILATVAARVDGDGIVLACGDRPALHIRAPDDAADGFDVVVWHDRVRARPAGDEADAWISALLGLPCRLVHMADPERARPIDPDYGRAGDHVSFADGFPLLITSQSSLDDLNAKLPEPVPMDRFRPNLVVGGAAPWAEDLWTTLRVGSVVFHAVKPCARCVVTTVDQVTGVKSPAVEPIRTLQTFRRDAKGQVLFGQNLIPAAAGRIAVGDPVTLLG